ncbi:MAG: hypothetical protein KBT88_03475 [Gammaproteobacteria bacterium]|nr:hypothetical protein [Gammaproteobacteria bacterium]MBQ0838821.1 hypothetical protein [Gammaproteobacteria bacterium]
METEILSMLSGGADVAMIAIGVMLMRMERRIVRLEFKLFGFNMGAGKERQG